MTSRESFDHFIENLIFPTCLSIFQSFNSFFTSSSEIGELSISQYLSVMRLHVKVSFEVGLSSVWPSLMSTTAFNSEKWSKTSSIVTFPVFLILFEFVCIICLKDLGSLVSFALYSCINVCFSAALALFIITLLSFPANLIWFKFSSLLLSLYLLLARLKAFLLSLHSISNQLLDLGIIVSNSTSNATWWSSSTVLQCANNNNNNKALFQAHIWPIICMPFIQ